MVIAIQIPTSPETVRTLPVVPVDRFSVSGLAGAWIAPGRQGEPMIPHGSVSKLPFKVWDTDYDHNSDLEDHLNQFESEGFSFLAVIPGTKGELTGIRSRVPPKIVMHKSPFASLVEQALALIDQLDSVQIGQLIDGLPDRVTDPICERCDLEDGFETVDADELAHVTFAEIPTNSVFTQNAKALVANSSDPNVDEIPW